MTIVHMIRYSLPTASHRFVSVIELTTYQYTMNFTEAHVFVQELVYDQVSALKTVFTEVPGSCVSNIAFVRSLAWYYADGYAPIATGRNVFGTVECLGEFSNHADLQVYI